MMLKNSFTNNVNTSGQITVPCGTYLVQLLGNDFINKIQILKYHIFKKFPVLEMGCSWNTQLFLFRRRLTVDLPVMNKILHC